MPVVGEDGPIVGTFGAWIEDGNIGIFERLNKNTTMLFQIGSTILNFNSNAKFWRNSNDCRIA